MMSRERMEACVEFGLQSQFVKGEWKGLTGKATDKDIVKWYEDESMVLQMRTFASQVYCDDPSGTVDDKKLREKYLEKANGKS